LFSRCPASYLTLRAGITDLSKDTGGTRHKVAKLIRHENYIAGSWTNDIAVLRVSNMITWPSHHRATSIIDMTHTQKVMNSQTK